MLNENGHQTRGGSASATPASATPPPPRPLRVLNLVRACTTIQDALLQLAQRAHADGPAAAGPELAVLLARIHAHAVQVEALCARAGSNPAALPTPSRRAYQWLKYLSTPANLEAQLATLAEARRIIAHMDWLTEGEYARYTVTFELSYSSYLYRTRPSGRSIRISAAQGFSGAPPEILEALIKTALSRRQRKARAAVTAYVAGEDYTEAALAFELAATLPQADVRGRHHDLAQSFARVNAQYFEGRLTSPRLTWSRSITQRLMGCYLAERDTLMLSLTLDRADVPAHIIDFVMYHELLHRVLGVPLVDGRRRPHGPAFRAAERQYDGYAAADAFLKQLTQSPQPSRRR